MQKVSDIMQEDLRDALANGYTRDASDLAILATASGIRDDLSNLRSIAASLLNEAGYCACGTKFGNDPRCPSCSRSIK
jgi:hypothetical protein